MKRKIKRRKYDKKERRMKKKKRESEDKEKQGNKEIKMLTKIVFVWGKPVQKLCVKRMTIINIICKWNINSCSD